MSETEIKIVYQTRATDGLYLGEVYPRRDPLEADRWVIPGGCVEDAPPAADAGCAVAWRNGAWAQVPDHRGETWWDGDGHPVVIEAIGDPADAGLTNVEPTPEAPPTPDPGTTPPTLVAQVLSVAVSGGDISSVLGIFNIAAALYLDAGQYMLFFLTSQPDADYIVTFSGGAPYMTVVDQGADYFTVEARNSVGGALVDPASFGIQVYRP